MYIPVLAYSIIMLTTDLHSTQVHSVQYTMYMYMYIAYSIIMLTTDLHSTQVHLVQYTCTCTYLY